jgi:hypothetical protein
VVRLDFAAAGPGTDVTGVAITPSRWQLDLLPRLEQVFFVAPSACRLSSRAAALPSLQRSWRR